MRLCRTTTGFLSRLVVASALVVFMRPAATGAQAAYPEISVRVEPTSATIGQHLKFTVTIAAPELERLSVKGPEVGDKTSWTLIATAPPEDTDSKGAVRRRSLNYTIASFDTGEALTPQMQISYQPPTGQPVVKEVPQVPVRIHSVLPAAITEPRDIKPPVTLPTSRWIYWLAAGVGAGLAAVLAWWLWRKLRGGLRNMISPPMRLDQWALDQIDSLERDRLIEHQKMNELYTRLSETIRVFLGKLYGFNAMDLTTYELLVRLDQESLPGLDETGTDAAEAVADLLDEADLVKFAKSVPDASVSRRSLEKARRLILRHWIYREERASAAAARQGAPPPPPPPVQPAEGSTQAGAAQSDRVTEAALPETGENVLQNGERR